MPVRYAAHQAGFPGEGPLAVDRLSGTIWNGQMVLDGGQTLAWSTLGWQSLFRFGWAIRWILTGPGTELIGDVRLRPGSVVAGPVSGAAGWPIVAAILPRAAVACDGRVIVSALDITATAEGRAAIGTVSVPAGVCARTDGVGGPVPVPALQGDVNTDADGVTLVVSAQDKPGFPLVTARLTSTDRLVLIIHKAGAAMVPGMPATTDSEVDLPLSVVLGG